LGVGTGQARVGVSQAARLVVGAHSPRALAQLLAPAAVAGVVFSANPLTGERNEAFINAISLSRGKTLTTLN
jgi:hypothetical protein